MADVPFLTRDSRVVFENRWIKLVEDRVEAVADRRDFTYTYLSVADSVMVVALTPANELLLIRQYRYPNKQFSLELPGGGGAGLAPAEAARRELVEETGHTAGNLEKIGDFVTYCGLSDETCHVVLATDLQVGTQQLEPTEHIEVVPTPLADLDALIAQGAFRDGMGLAALHIARKHLEI